MSKDLEGLLRRLVKEQGGDCPIDPEWWEVHLKAYIRFYRTVACALVQERPALEGALFEVQAGECAKLLCGARWNPGSVILEPPAKHLVAAFDRVHGAAIRAMTMGPDVLKGRG